MPFRRAGVLAFLQFAADLDHRHVCDLSTSPLLDVAGAEMLRTLHAELAKRGIPFCLVEARSSVRDMLRVEGVDDKVGRIDRLTTLADAIEGFQSSGPSKP